MLKGLLVCFAVLFAQLAVLHVIDVRLYNSPQDARNTAVTTVTPHKDEDDKEHKDEVDKDLKS
ncbi:hypothetical protein DQ400_00290 [Vreelandella sulfidaeris]|uniref:Uncharacterized protein n=1 Tax=Vreelandella sulfidaeris TaxID=115553 RepID=A0A365TSW5_9GAMM|nr:hypothetical protein [Halomonas sulfidaeris]RBI69181.1 hypothetical protein DQ400_00290 [Halomonas sulfidaeris]